MDPSSKESIRARVLLKRSGLPLPSRIEKSAEISKRLQSSDLFQTAQCIHLYLSNQDEVETTLLIQKAFFSKKKVAVPVIDAQKKMFFSELSTLDVQTLESGPFGIRQPKLILQKYISPEKIDLWIIPGVSFDIMGGRLGYGGGYYDRALAQTHTSIIALAFEVQVIPDPLPLDKRDVPVDWIFTEKRSIHCEENRSGREYY